MRHFLYLMFILTLFTTINTSYAYIPGKIYGTVRDLESQKPISSAAIKTSAGRSAITFSDGSFLIDHEEGNFTLTVFAKGYESYTVTINIKAFKTIEKNIVLTPEALNYDPPVIESVSSARILNGKTSTSIHAMNVTSTIAIEKVEGVIILPENPQIIILKPLSDYPVLVFQEIAGTNDYSATYHHFSTIGKYKIIIQATDIHGNTSRPLTATVIQTIGSDIFEQDNSIEQAKPVVLNAREARRHTFHMNGDQDWIKFYGIVGKTYRIEISHLEALSEPVIDFYGPGNTYNFSESLIDDVDDYGVTFLEHIVYKEGVYFVCVKNRDPNIFGANTGYDLRVGYPEGDFEGNICGIITDADGNVLKGVHVKTTKGSGISDKEGIYAFNHQPGQTSITFMSSSFCYLNKTSNLNVARLVSTRLDMTMEKISLSDAIKSLQVISGFSFDIEGTFVDDEIDLNDAIYMLKCIDY